MNGMLTDKKVYDRNFASFYNYVLTDQAREYAHYILDYASKKVTEKNIVDYMCGTGNLLKIFEDAGWKTTGIDLSTNMLDVAKL
ncbi:methyltransferase domain-containing protein [Lactobacillus taiwanensis]|uniref:methyltransferase domain-containing protein n=1 Tax=Lactobacillus taiwanensis TaxID=508451 RepID=UPI000B99C001|nr:methyltransferase domain-containing protein [Lactobacillus taiwanensis]OYR94735.1 hypothetical protein CBF51_10180 [Lactobacillus taiwanensis]OYR99767.1 hypothetical protein CBF61_08480 [Lactobacillus taiwanensis]OYS12918.1 hypothetical protein CBF69_09955 [Lactobacillus taiwanensis]OYS30359.1 hypothetical protein CBF75_08130 [Lactobacillus taiwanensis]OYS31496.1 hypothetical protein CBF78_08765 [Lactobacillus taiwanensis]